MIFPLVNISLFFFPIFWEIIIKYNQKYFISCRTKNLKMPINNALEHHLKMRENLNHVKVVQIKQPVHLDKLRLTPLYKLSKRNSATLSTKFQSCLEKEALEKALSQLNLLFSFLKTMKSAYQTLIFAVLACQQCLVQLDPKFIKVLKVGRQFSLEIWQLCQLDFQ